VTAVVIDASAGVEIVADTRRGRALARLVPRGSEGWVPEHFYAEVLGVLRRQLLVEGRLTETQATAAVDRLGAVASSSRLGAAADPGRLELPPQHDGG
jgi:predicted nucleic acid-binding protein